MVFLVRRAGLPIVVECGDVVIFSAAHLHRSIPNTTDKTRFSAEVRTVYMPDVVAGRGAPQRRLGRGVAQAEVVRPVRPSIASHEYNLEACITHR